jgi:hypothetical protein
MSLELLAYAQTQVAQTRLLAILARRLRLEELQQQTAEGPPCQSQGEGST